ncbi:MAG: iron-containing redox enzyme family protein [Myxococcota bacterium]
MRQAFAHRACRHPYLTALAVGDLPNVEEALKDFAHQYAFYSAGFSIYLRGLVAQLEEPAHIHLVAENLAEEEGRIDGEAGRPHGLLFLDFQEAIGVNPLTADPPIASVRSWRRRFDELCSVEGPAVAVAALGVGTELIVPAIYSQILRSLRAHTTLQREDLLFFELHSVCDEAHSEDLLYIAESFAGTPEGRQDLARGARIAWELRATFWDEMLARAEQMPPSVTRARGAS